MGKAAVMVALGAVAVMVAFAAPESDFHIPFERYQLKNGLRVVLSRDTAVPVVSVYLIYNVGARSEAKGQTGFANLSKYLMFEGSANVRKGEHIKYVRGNGGQTSGSTHPDFTDYSETMPSNKLDLALWLESDRMRSPGVTAENIRAVRDQVGREHLLRFDNDEYSTTLVEKWPALVFSNFESSHPLTGSSADMEAARVDNMSQFIRTYYAPNNAVLVIEGDFEIAEAKKMVEQYFASIPSQPQPGRVDISEPLRSEGKTGKVTDQYARVPAIAVGWQAPRRHSSEFHALQMLDAVLTSGPNSQLQRDLMRGLKSVIECKSNAGWPFGDFYNFKEPGEYGIFVVYKPNYLPEQIEDQIQKEIAYIASEGVGEVELRRVKAELRLKTITHLETSLERARLLGQYDLLDGNPDMLDEDLADLFAVTSARIQEVARKYLTPARRDVLEIEPGKDPYLMASDHYHLFFENEWTRASLVTYGPHEASPLHEHPSAPTVIYIYITDGGQFRFSHIIPHRVTLIRPAVKSGEIRLSHSELETHTVEYLGDAPTEYVRIELRTETRGNPVQNAKLPAPALEPTKPAILKEFENAQFRVLRVICAAGEQCPASRNPEDPAIVTVMTGPDRGAVRWSPAPEKGPLDEVRIELKTPPATSTKESK